MADTDVKDTPTVKDKSVVGGILDDLSQDVKTPEDQKVLDAWRKEQDEHRADILGEAATRPVVGELVVAPDGTVERKVNVVKTNTEENPSGTYKNGLR